MTRDTVFTRPVLLAMLLLVAGSCSDGDREVLLVSAASSLTEVFTELESVFERAHPDVDVVLNLAGSSVLREQILEGAAVDIFASADAANIGRVVDEGLAASWAVFAVNSALIAVPEGNPAGIVGLDDFSRDELFLAICAPEVPCGGLAQAVFARAGVRPILDSLEPDVRSLLTKISGGELDAGIVFRTDVLASPTTVDGVPIGDDVNLFTEYAIADLSGGIAAQSFFDLVLGPTGQAVLADHGFGAP